MTRWSHRVLTLGVLVLKAAGHWLLPVLSMALLLFALPFTVLTALVLTVRQLRRSAAP